MESTSTWVSITKQPVKRKRAELACEHCHQKKTKCDLLARTAQHLDKCTNCASAGRDCQRRPSLRANSGRRPGRSAKIDRVADALTDGDAFAAALEPSALPGADFTNLPTPPAFDISAQQVVSSQARQQVSGNTPRYSNASPDTRLTGSRVEQGTHHPDSGFQYVYGPENSLDAQDQVQSSVKTPQRFEELPDPDLQQSFLETYFDYCYPWCPVLDRSTASCELSASPMLANAVALAGSYLKPPIIAYTRPETYYDRARKAFYTDEETDNLTALKALCLFYWWSPRPPTTVHRHSSWWWQSVIIRHCQHMGIHREPDPEQALQLGLDLSIRRRIWWTAFARERLTAICQNRPCIIDPDDCSIQELTLDDFPEQDRGKGEVFIYWVRLCAIIGKIAKHIARSYDRTHSFPDSLARELLDWQRSLPPHLQLPIYSNRTPNFNRDTHQLHLPYLTVVIILHVKRSSLALPQAYPPAILAATCIARIFKDILSRGETKFLMPITCWYTGTAFMAMQEACRSQELATSAAEDLDILSVMIDQLRKMWPTGNIFYRGFQRLRAESATTSTEEPASQFRRHRSTAEGGLEYEGGEIEYTSYFPFASAQTSNLAAHLLAPEPVMNDLFSHDAFPDGMDLDFGTFFEPFGSFTDLDNL